MINSINVGSVPLFTNKKPIQFSNINLFYGKNGSGKSTLAKKLANQVDNPDYCVTFDGINRFIRPDEQLDAILLGTKNISIEEKIVALSLQKDMASTDLTNLENNLTIDKSNFDASVDRYQDFVWDNIFRHFHDIFPEDLRGWGGSKTSFTNKLKQLHQLEKPLHITELTETEILQRQNQIKAGVIVEEYTNLILELDKSRLKSVMGETVGSAAKSVIAKRVSTRKLEGWVEQGRAYLAPNEPCPLCGQVLSPEYYEEIQQQLSEIIDTSYRNLQENIEDVMHQVEAALTSLQKWEAGIEAKSERVSKDFQVSVVKESAGIRTELQLLKKIIEEKRDKVQEPVSVDENLLSLDKSLAALSNKIDGVNAIISKNNQLVKNSAQEKNELRRQVFLLMEKRCQEPDIKLLQSEVKELQEKYQSTKQSVDASKTAFDALEAEISNLKSQTRSEQEAVARINDLLGLLGNKRFKLALAENDSSPSGFYTIEDVFGARRSVTALSTGEQNLIAFLYFFYLVESKIDEEGDLTVIIDDPVTSNDDQSMFLIVTMIQNLFFRTRELNDSRQGKLQAFVLTHNSSFYLNLKEWTRNPYTGKNRSFRLIANSAGTEITTLQKKDEDILNNYDELWREARSSFESNQKQTLWNQIRRILETYIKFNNWSGTIETAVRDSVLSQENTEQKLIALQLIKIAHANSHSIDDLMQDLSPWSVEQIINAFRFVIGQLGGEAHFDSHWSTENF